MSNTPTPTSRATLISGFLLGTLVGLVPWAIAQFIPDDDTADSETSTEAANSNQALQQGFSTSPTTGTPVFTGPGSVQSPNSATSPGTTQTGSPQAQAPRQVYQPSGGGTQTPGTRPQTQAPRQTNRVTQRPVNNTNRPNSGSGARNTGSNNRPIRGLW
ncbi:hypothetical protein IQ235_08515 [Oscillatoriales cyanobacterium LEGE 11467]|uniref:Uncharacterized protein n=1 Tax=Zarconia navalis LEGE 11467 TaxID=1828826 RepID=A0A928W019_9CYAN|nr:hypothetical protein [Zarconia navalis]MBE9040820.1 hypothetical protein [Zarconia navalis LEGE 11467]